jgi:flagellar hook-basal body complex protein FliE
MFDSLSNAAVNAARTARGAGAATANRSADATSTSFADSLKSSIEEVARMQQEATTATTDLATGRTGDLSGVMTAVEKSDLAFKTLLAIRSKLIDAYDEIKAMPM